MASMGQQFSADISAYADLAAGNLEKLARRCIFRMAFNIVQDTPVHIGFLRASWQPSIGEPETAAKEGVTADPGGSGAMAQLGLVIAQIKVGHQFWMINNAAYAMRIEYGFVGEDSLGRYYNQAGQFFVATNLSKWNEVVADEAAKIRAGQ